jgi:hypothetical protein
MKIFLVFLLSLLTFGCSDTYQYDEQSFDEKMLQMVGERTGIKFPQGSHGLAMIHNKGLNQEFVAKIGIPTASQENLADQIGQISDVNMTICNSMMDKVNWWKPLDTIVLLQKTYLENHNTVQVFLCQTGNQIILYVYWGSA